MQNRLMHSVYIMKYGNRTNESYLTFGAFFWEHMLEFEIFDIFKFYIAQIIAILSISPSSAGRYDQKFISRYFSKLYRFHGI